MTSGVMHMVCKQLQCACACTVTLPVVYAAYMVDRRSTRLLSHDSHVTFLTMFTVSIVRNSILFVLMYILLLLYITRLYRVKAE